MGSCMQKIAVADCLWGSNGTGKEGSKHEKNIIHYFRGCTQCMHACIHHTLDAIKAGLHGKQKRCIAQTWACKFCDSYRLLFLASPAPWKSLAAAHAIATATTAMVAYPAKQPYVA